MSLNDEVTNEEGNPGPAFDSSLARDARRPVAAQAGAPEGWKLVPTEATLEMFRAACEAEDAGCTEEGIYRAMIAASPAAPTTQQIDVPSKSVDILEVANERRYMVDSNWRGIWDEAPVQGEGVLATDGKTVIAARWFAPGWAEYGNSSDEIVYLPEGWVTHWAPFPSAK